MVRSRSRTRVTAVAAALALGVSMTATSTAWGAAREHRGDHGHHGHHQGGRFQPGAPGLGDPYFPLYGNGGYDTRAYDLDVTYDPDTDQLEGVATIRSRATDDLDRFDLDLVGLTVRSVTIDGKPVKGWSRTDHELVITPRKKLKDGDRFTTVVRYDGVPTSFTIPSLGIPSGWLNSDDGAVVAGEPEVAAFWYPVNDHPQDKASYRVDVTVPEGLEALSNGRLRGHDTEDGWTTWRWAEREPIASYLVTATIGQFDITQYTTDSGIPVVDAVDPDLNGSADNALAAEPEVIDFLSSQFGPYPFHDLGGIVDDYPQLYFALENQTRPVYSRYFFQPGDNPDEIYVIAHELAHQWYGDSVSVHFWRDIWLNEGFAAYAEWLWSDHTGDGSPQEIFDFYYSNHPEGDSFWDNTTYDPGEENLFDNNSTYIRGAMTLQALRMTVGDAAFFDILRTWHRQRAGGDGSTEQFTRLAERLTGRNLDDLFREWLYEEGKPPYPGGQAAARSARRSARGAGVPDQVRSLRERVATGQRF